jgi:NAD(P)-dependent dehydrogenase (short-subunit alcohol dehydrogenase family)
MGERFTITLAEQPVEDGNPGLPLGKDTVFVVTGAAGGITSAIIADLAAASGGIFHLLDLVAPPNPDKVEIRLFREDKEALKQELIEAAKAAGGARPRSDQAADPAIERECRPACSRGGPRRQRVVYSDLLDGPA